MSPFFKNCLVITFCILQSLVFQHSAVAGDGKEKARENVEQADCSQLNNKGSTTCTTSDTEQTVIMIYSVSKNYAFVKICTGELNGKIMEFDRVPYGAYGSAIYRNDDGYELYTNHDDRSGTLSGPENFNLGAYCSY